MKKKKVGGKTMAQLKKMSDSEFAKEIKALQKDPEFITEVHRFIKETTN
jgi:hypothetical protein